jgi:preprotein translocase subunit SecD
VLEIRKAPTKTMQEDDQSKRHHADRHVSIFG